MKTIITFSTSRYRHQPATGLIFLAFLLSFVLSQQASAQVPQGINYQAVVRDNNGMIVKAGDVAFRISLRQSSEDGTVIYSETHQVTTSNEGIISLEIGRGTVVSGDFSAIDWSQGPFYLEVEADVTGGTDYVLMGNSELLSVPFAMQSAGVSSLKQLDIRGDDITSDSALFTVRRKDGQIVFAVYNDGVRVYIDTASGKRPRGGFAIGSFNFNKKGESQDYMRVTPDSTRIYVKKDKSEGHRGGFAIGSFSRGKGGSTNFLSLTPENYFIGEEAGYSNTTGLYNSFLGYKAGRSNTTGEQNLFMGYLAGYQNIEGSGNIFIGNLAGLSNVNGEQNIFIGQESGYNNISGKLNTCIGYQSGYSLDTSDYNTFIGFWAGRVNTSGELNTFLGAQAGEFNVAGKLNTVIGAFAGQEGALGNFNTFVGMRAGSKNTGNGNTFLGVSAGVNNDNGNDNVFIGRSSGEQNTGTSNVFVGAGSGAANDGDHNVFIGDNAGNNMHGSNKLVIHNADAESTQSLIYGEFDHDVLRLNALTTIRDALILEPQSSPPADPVEGMMYMDRNDHTLKVYDGTTWHALW